MVSLLTAVLLPGFLCIAGTYPWGNPAENTEGSGYGKQADFSRVHCIVVNNSGLITKKPYSVNHFLSSIHEKAEITFTDMDEQNNHVISLRLLISERGKGEMKKSL